MNHFLIENYFYINGLSDVYNIIKSYVDFININTYLEKSHPTINGFNIVILVNGILLDIKKTNIIISKIMPNLDTLKTEGYLTTSTFFKDVDEMEKIYSEYKSKILKLYVTDKNNKIQLNAFCLITEPYESNLIEIFRFFSDKNIIMNKNEFNVTLNNYKNFINLVTLYKPDSI